MLFFSFLFYYIFAQITKGKIQYHSIFHCLTSVGLTSYFFYKNEINLLTLNITSILNHIDDDFTNTCAANSIGYFLADILDIFLDKVNIKRRNYILHHIVAITGISTIYFKNNFSIFAIWCLEIGGIFHHLKYFSEVYLFHRKFFLFLYFLVYTSSRIYFTLNVLGILFLYFSFADFVCLMVGILLAIQNTIWLITNIRKLSQDF